jgi:hypothetical protein
VRQGRCRRKHYVRKVHLFARSLFRIHGDLLTHSSQDDDIYGRQSVFNPLYKASLMLTGILLVDLEELLDLLANLTFWDFDIILGGTVVGHEGQEAVISNIELFQTLARVSCAHLLHSTYELVFLAGNVGNLHIVGGWGEIFELLVGEDIDGDQVDLCVTVLASLGGGHFDNLAWALLDDDEAVLPPGRTLHRVGGGSTSIGALEGVLMLTDSVSSCSSHMRRGRRLRLGRGARSFHSPGHRLRRPC